VSDFAGWEDLDDGNPWPDPDELRERRWRDAPDNPELEDR